MVDSNADILAKNEEAAMYWIIDHEQLCWAPGNYNLLLWFLKLNSPSFFPFN